MFLHGIGSNMTSFERLFPGLPDHLNLLAWNAPGYLASDPLDETWPLPNDYSRRLARFLDDLGIGSVHLVGHSLGALIAASFARRFSDRVDGLVLASATNGYRVPRGGRIPMKVLARIEDLKRLGPAAFARARAPGLVHDPERNKEVVAHVESAMAEVNPDGYAQAACLLASGDLPDDLKFVSRRPGFIIGTQDGITPFDQTRIAASAWAAAHGSHPSVIEIEDSGHAVYLQRPAEFRAALLKHLSNAGVAALAPT